MTGQAPDRVVPHPLPRPSSPPVSSSPFTLELGRVLSQHKAVITYTARASLVLFPLLHLLTAPCPIVSLLNSLRFHDLPQAPPLPGSLH